MIINTMITQPMNAGIGLALALIGLPIYFSKKKQATKAE
jgi:basic amino acid/polyamine antiporter, APA family